MASFGRIINNYEPEIDEMYEHFASYLKNPQMTKLKDADKFSLYISRVECLLANQYRYIIATVNADTHRIGTKEFLSNLRWEALQTRTLQERHNLPQHAYVASRDTPLNCIISRISSNTDTSTYKCDKYPLKITLLHTKADPMEYQPSGTVINALETYQTIVVKT